MRPETRITDRDAETATYLDWHVNIAHRREHLLKALAAADEAGTPLVLRAFLRVEEEKRDLAEAMRSGFLQHVFAYCAKANVESAAGMLDSMRFPSGRA